MVEQAGIATPGAGVGGLTEEFLEQARQGWEPAALLFPWNPARKKQQPSPDSAGAFA